MNTFGFIRVTLVLLMAFSAFLLLACGDTTTNPDDHGVLEVTMENTPNPATVNTEITFTFEVEEGGEHTAVTMFSCEVEKAGTGNHEEMALTAAPNEVGHYVGTRTFTEAGTYELHFNFMHDNEMEERAFEVEVQ